MNDDWAYAMSARSMANGMFPWTDWQGVPLLSQAFWGALWIKLFGFSFLTLRVSMLLIASLGMWYLFRIISMYSSKAFAAVVALLFFLHPVSIHLSVSFMTDVFALSISLGLTFHLTKLEMKNHSRIDIWMAILFLMIGVLCRQTVLIIPIAFLIASFLKRGIQQTMLHPVTLILGSGIGILLIHDLLLALLNNPPHTYGYQLGMLREAISNPISRMPHFFNYMLGTIVFAGWLLLPFGWLRLKRISPAETAVFCGLFILYAIRRLTLDTFWPGTADVLHPNGLGPWLFPGFNSNELAEGNLMQWCLPVFVAIGMLSFVQRIAKVDWRSPLLWIFILGILPFALVYLSDRYVWYASCFLLIAFLHGSKTEITISKPLILWVSTVFVLTVLLNHTYFTMRRTHWEVASEWMDKHGDSVNGGFEFNAWHRFRMDGYNGERPENSWAGEDEYRITPVNHVAGYRKIGAESIDGFSWPHDSVYVHQRVTGTGR